MPKYHDVNELPGFGMGQVCYSCDYFERGGMEGHSARFTGGQGLCHRVYQTTADAESATVYLDDTCNLYVTNEG